VIVVIVQRKSPNAIVTNHSVNNQKNVLINVALINLPVSGVNGAISVPVLLPVTKV